MVQQLVDTMWQLTYPIWTGSSVVEQFQMYFYFYFTYKVMNHRLFCMANFSCLGTEIKTLLKTTIGSCCSALQYYLRRVLCQLVDLGASVSVLIVRQDVGMIFESQLISVYSFISIIQARLRFCMMAVIYTDVGLHFRMSSDFQATVSRLQS